MCSIKQRDRKETEKKTREKKKDPKTKKRSKNRQFARNDPYLSRRDCVFLFQADARRVKGICMGNNDPNWIFSCRGTIDDT